MVSTATMTVVELGFSMITGPASALIAKTFARASQREVTLSCWVALRT
jgi:hypothetical protein